MAASFHDPEPAFGRAGRERLVDLVPFVAASDWADLYLPRSVLARLPPANPQAEARAYAELRRARQNALDAALRPAPSPPTPGRNEPCSCGSGKKYKKCCGTAK
jgi:preprotein translocase subunit SecA